MALEEDKNKNELPIETPGKGASQEEREEFAQNLLWETFEAQQEKIQKEMNKEETPSLKKEENDIPEKEYNEFVDKNIVSQERLNSIAEKVKNNQQLTAKETAIFTNKTSEINNIIKKAATPEKKESLSEKKTKLYAQTLLALENGQITIEEYEAGIDHIRALTHDVVTEEVKPKPVPKPASTPAPTPTSTPAPAPKPASFKEKLVQSQKDNEEHEEFFENIPSFNEKIQTVVEKWNDLFDVKRDAFASHLAVITPEDLDTAVASIDANMLKQNQNLLQVLFIKQKAITDFLVSKYGKKLTKQDFEEQMKPFVEELSELAAKVDELRSILGKDKKRMTIEDVRRAKQLMSELNITVPARTRTTKEGRERKEKLSEQAILQKKQLKVMQAFIDTIRQSKEEYKKKPKGKFAAIARWARNVGDWALQFDFDREASRDIGKLQVMMDNMRDPNKRTNRLRQEYLKEKKRELAIDYPLIKNVDVDALWNAIPEATKTPQPKPKEKEKGKEKEKEKELSVGEKLAQKLSGAQSLEDINERLGNAISNKVKIALIKLLQSYKDNKELKPDIHKIKEDISQIFKENGLKDMDSVITLIANTINIKELGIVQEKPVKKGFLERFRKRFRRSTENIEKIGEVTSEKGKLKETEKGLKKTGKKITKAEETIAKKEENLKTAVTSEKTETPVEPQNESVVPPTSIEEPVIPLTIPTEDINKPEENINKVITEEIYKELEKINEDINNAKKNKSFKEYFSKNTEDLKKTLLKIQLKMTNEGDKKYIKVLHNALVGIARSNTEEDLMPLANYLEEVLVDLSEYDKNSGWWRKDTREAQKTLLDAIKEANKPKAPKSPEKSKEPTDIEAKKADIERRRKEEIEEAWERAKKNTPKNALGFEAPSEKILKEIDAKYDEELKLVEKVTTSEEAEKPVVHTTETTKDKEGLKENYKSFKFLTDKLEYGFSEDENMFKMKIDGNRAEVLLNEAGFRYLLTDYKSYSNDTFDYVSTPYRGINFTDISVTPAIFRKEGDKWIVEKKGIINWRGGSPKVEVTTTENKVDTSEETNKPIRYKEYDQKFHYFDQSEKTTFSLSEGENCFSYNSQTGEVLPLKEGWNMIKSNPSYLLDKSFEYSPYEISTTPIEQLTFIPAKIDKSGKLISKGRIGLE